MKSLFLPGCFFILVTLTASAMAQPGLELIDSYSGLIDSRDMIAAQGKIWVLDSLGVSVFDPDSDEPALTRMAQVTRGKAIAVSGSLLAVGRGFEGLSLLEISDGDAVELVSIYTPGEIKDLEFIGDDCLLLAADYSGLITVDISDPSNPQFANFCGVAGNLEVRQLSVRNNMAICTGDKDVMTFDISDPTDPVAIDYHMTYGSTYRNALSETGDLLWTVYWVYYEYDGHEGYLDIFDISPSGYIEQLAGLNITSSAHIYSNPTVHSVGSYLFLSFNDLYMYDNANPDNPLLIDQISGTARQLTTIGSTLYACNDNDMQVYTITWPTDLELHLPAAKNDNGSSLGNVPPNHKFITSQNHTKQPQVRVPVSNWPPGTDLYLMWRETFSMPDDIVDMERDGDLLFTADKHTVTLSNVADPENRITVSTIAEDSTDVKCVAPYGDYLYVGRKPLYVNGENINGGISIYDVSDEQNPAYLTDLLTEETIEDLLIKTDTLFVAEDWFRMYSIENATDPEQLFEWQYGGTHDAGVKRLSSYGDWLLAGVKLISVPVRPIYYSYATQLNLFSLTLDDKPYLVKRLLYDEIPYDLSLLTGILSVSVHSEQDNVMGTIYWYGAIYDWRIPFYPLLIEETEWTDRGDGVIYNGPAGSKTMLQYENYLFVLTDHAQVYDASDPFDRELIVDAPDVEADRIMLDFPYLYTAEDTLVRIFELTDDSTAVTPGDPDDPNEPEDPDDPDEPSDSTAADLQLPEQFELVEPYPNPFNNKIRIDVALPETARLTITIHNVLGQPVATLARDDFSAGIRSFTFDARGHASGLYFVRVNIPDHLDEIRKVILVR